MHKFINSGQIRAAFKEVESNIKKGSVQAGDWPSAHTVATMVFDNVCPKAEVHEHAFDVWFVISGTGKFILGGELNKPEQVGENELVADSISGGESFIAKEGDIIDIPPGVAHQIDVLGGRMETVIVKISPKNYK